MSAQESTAPAPLLQGSDLHFAYRGRPVLAGAGLGVGAGEVVSLLGANGAGKSTLLRLLMGFSRPQSGRVEFAGRALADYPRRELARHLAYVPQVHVTPFPYLVREVVLMGRLPHTGLLHSPRADDHAAVEAVLEEVGIAPLAGRAYTEISGGERQLCLIARALVQGARVLVMDEPATGLDYGNQVRLLERLGALAARGYAILLTTHHPDHALMASTRVALLSGGRVVADGLPDQVVTPEAIRTLYSVEVVPFRTPSGVTVFVPAAHAGA